MEIASSNFRHFSAALNLLAKVGKEILIEVEPSKTTFKALSDAKSSFAHVSFLASFFSYYAPTSFSQRSSGDGNGRNRHDEIGDSSFKVSAKVLCSVCKASIVKGLNYVVLRSSQGLPSSSPTLSSSSVAASAQRISQRLDGREAVHELVIEIVMLSGVRRIHRIACQDTESITATYNTRDETNSILVSNPNIFAQVINHIGTNNEVLIEANNECFNIKTFNNKQMGASLSGTKDFLEKNNMSSGVSLMISEFESYSFNSACYIENDERAGEDSSCIDLVVPVKELKAFLNFCEHIGINECEIMFTCGGAPMRLAASNASNIEIFIILATLLPQFRDRSNINEAESTNANSITGGSRKEPRSGNDNAGEEEMGGHDDFDGVPARAGSRRDILQDDNNHFDEDNYVGDANYDSDGDQNNNGKVNGGNEKGKFDSVSSQAVDFSNLINAIIQSPAPSSRNNANANSSNDDTIHNKRSVSSRFLGGGHDEDEDEGVVSRRLSRRITPSKVFDSQSSYGL